LVAYCIGMYLMLSKGENEVKERKTDIMCGREGGVQVYTGMEQERRRHVYVATAGVFFEIV